MPRVELALASTLTSAARRLLLALVACLLALPALADNNVDDLMIPDDLGPKGRAGLAQFFGRPLVINEGKWAGIFNFDAGGRVAWTKPNGKTMQGHFGDSAYEDRMCLDFGYDFNDCFEVRQRGDNLDLQPEDGGNRFSGRAQPGKAGAELPQRMGDVIEAFNTIMTAIAQDKMDELDDPEKDEVRLNALSGPSYWTTVQIGEDFCLHDENGFEPSIDCNFFYEDDAPSAEYMYEAMVGQLRIATAGRVKDADIDSEVWLKYAEIDWAKLGKEGGVKKKAKKDFHHSKLDAERRSTFVFTNGTKAKIDLGYRSICKGVRTECRFYYGVWVSFSRLK